MRLLTISIIAVVLSTVAARAAVTQYELNQVEIAPQPGAALPMGLLLSSEDGTIKPLQVWLGAKPSIWVLADYTCKTLCGPVISIVSDALAHSGLRPGADFHLVVVGLDPKDTAADAAAMKRAQVGGSDDGLSAASYFLRGDANAITSLTEGLGFRSVYDRDHDQFAHPAAAFVVTPDGRLTRALPGLAVDPATIRLAVIEADGGAIGTWSDHIRLLCYGYDPASGTYTVAIGRILPVAGAATIVVLALFIGFLLRHDHVFRQREADGPRFAAPSRTPTTKWRR